MAIPTAVNGQITDAVTQSNVKVLGDSPAMAMGAIYQSLAHGQMYQNAVAHQQKTNVVRMVATVSCVAQLLDMSRRHSWPETEEEEAGE